MIIKAFFKLVEIQTKVASVFPFIAGNLYAYMRFSKFNLLNAMIMFFSLLCIDMATTAINNYMDYKRAVKKEGYNYEEHNAIVKDKLDERHVKKAILTLLILGMVSGFILFLVTDWIVLCIGAVSFAIGILYSYGPLPISRTPLGELVSGCFMGGLITFLAIHIHIIDMKLIDLSLNGELISLIVNWYELILIAIYSFGLIAGIANIMLANNICDIEDDLMNKRHTLPIVIGKDKALFIFKGVYFMALLAFILLTVLKVFSPFVFILIIVWLPIQKNIKTFDDTQDKATTFVLAVKNFVLISFILILSNIISLI
jgi:1,4-dihydroxy-2-naphthoate octaprenyltransferase